MVEDTGAVCSTTSTTTTATTMITTSITTITTTTITKTVSGSGDQKVCIWDAATGAVEQTLVGHTDTVCSVAFNHDGTKIVSGSGDQKIISKVPNCCLVQ